MASFILGGVSPEVGVIKVKSAEMAMSLGLWV